MVGGIGGGVVGEVGELIGMMSQTSKMFFLDVVLVGVVTAEAEVIVLAVVVTAAVGGGIIIIIIIISNRGIIRSNT